MPNVADIKLVVIWEDELRKASKLLQEARDEVDEAKISAKMSVAYAACEVALHGITDDQACIMIGNKDLHDQAKARRTRRAADQSNVSTGDT